MGPHDGTFALGLLIDETKPVANSGSGTAGTHFGFAQEIKNLPIVRRVSDLVNTMTNAYDKTIIDAYKDGVCRLPAQGYETTDFDMSDARTAALVTAGERTMREFFRTFKLPS